MTPYSHARPQDVKVSADVTVTPRPRIRARIASSVWAGLFLVVAIDGAPLAGQDTPTTRPLLRGTLIDDQSGAAVEAALVYLIAPDGSVLANTVSDAAGLFSLTPPGAGTFGLRAERIGYHVRQERGVEAAPGDTVDIELGMTPTPLLVDTIAVSVARVESPLGVGEQLVRGRLIDDLNGEGISYGVIRLLDGFEEAVATVLSGEGGRFQLVSPRAGRYRLQAERLGYRTGTSGEIHLMLGDTVSLDFRLSVDAVLMDPLEITASSQSWENRRGLVGMEDFFRRYSRLSGSGFGEFMTRDSIRLWERRTPTTGHMLQITTRSVRQVEPVSGEVTLRGGCSPSYYLNGSPVPYQMVQPLSPEELEAVEVYVQPGIPVELGRGYPCGVVSYWSRQTPPDTIPESRIGRHVALTTLLGGLLFVFLIR